MKIKIISICLGIVWCIILLLSINIYTREPICEYAHLDGPDESKDVIPTGEMAKKLVEIYEEKYDQYKIKRNEQSNQDIKIPYDIEVIYHEQDYQWVVVFRIIADGYSVLDGDYAIGVRRDNGMLSDIPGGRRRRRK